MDYLTVTDDRNQQLPTDPGALYSYYSNVDEASLLSSLGHSSGSNQVNNGFSMDFFPQPKLENGPIGSKLAPHDFSMGSGYQQSLVESYANPYQYLTSHLQLQHQTDQQLLQQQQQHPSVSNNNNIHAHQQQLQQLQHQQMQLQRHNLPHNLPQQHTNIGQQNQNQPLVSGQQQQVPGGAETQNYQPKPANNRKNTRGGNTKRANNRSGGAGGATRGVRGRGESISLDNIVVISPDAALYKTTGLFHEELGSINIKDIKGVYKNCRGIWAAQWTDAIGQRHTKYFNPKYYTSEESARVNAYKFKLDVTLQMERAKAGQSNMGGSMTSTCYRPISNTIRPSDYQYGHQNGAHPMQFYHHYPPGSFIDNTLMSYDPQSNQIQQQFHLPSNSNNNNRPNVAIPSIGSIIAPLREENQQQQQSVPVPVPMNLNLNHSYPVAPTPHKPELMDYVISMAEIESLFSEDEMKLPIEPPNIAGINPIGIAESESNFASYAPNNPQTLIDVQISCYAVFIAVVLGFCPCPKCSCLLLPADISPEMASQVLRWAIDARMTNKTASIATSTSAIAAASASAGSALDSNHISTAPALIPTKIEDVAQSSWTVHSAVAVASSSATTTGSHQNNVVHAAKTQAVVPSPPTLPNIAQIGGLLNEAMFGTNNRNHLWKTSATTTNDNSIAQSAAAAITKTEVVIKEEEGATQYHHQRPEQHLRATTPNEGQYPSAVKGYYQGRNLSDQVTAAPSPEIM